MTTPWEGQQPVWSISGLAEVLSCGAASDQPDGPIVRFNRRRTADTASSGHARSALSHTQQRRLDQWGYVVVPDVGDARAAAQVVRTLGHVIPQRNGRVTYDATMPHTEASGRFISPAYVALHRRRGGQTNLLDVRRLVAALDEDELALMTDVELHFPGPAGGVRTTLLSADASGDTVARFNYDLLAATDDSPLGQAGRALARRVRDMFRERCISVQIPDGALLIWDDQRMLHAMPEHPHRSRHLTRFCCGDRRRG